MKRILYSFKKCWILIEENILVTLILLMGLDILAQIISRSLLTQPFSFTEEVARYIQIWITFFGIGYCFRKKQHIRATFLYDKFPRKVQQLVDLLTNMFMIWLSVMLIPQGMLLYHNQRGMKWITLDLSMGYVALAVPVGFAILLCYMIVDTILKARALCCGLNGGKGNAKC